MLSMAVFAISTIQSQDLKDVGVLPEIYTISINGDKVTSDDNDVELTIVDNGQTKPLTVSYTGRKADGSASRGIAYNQKSIGCKVSDTGLQDKQSFSVAFWAKFTSFGTDTWSLLEVRDGLDSWPQSRWGWLFLYANNDGRIASHSFREAKYEFYYPLQSTHEFFYQYDGLKFELNTWTHFVVTFDYDPEGTGKFRSKLYINGVQKQAILLKKGNIVGNSDTYETKEYAMKQSDWISTGGLTYFRSAVEGAIDDFQIWSKAMDEDDIKASYAGLDRNNLPSDVLCYWDFEDDANEDNTFSSLGANSGVKLYSYEYDLGNGCECYSQFTYGFETAFGSPFSKGTASQAVTAPKWSADNCEITDATGSDTEGSANVTFTKDGDYKLTLTLENGYGSATADYPVFKVIDPASVNDVLVDGDIAAYSNADAIFVQVEQDGQYELTVYDMQGRIVATRAAALVAGQLMQVKAHNDNYIVKVRKDGRDLRTIKLRKH